MPELPEVEHLRRQLARRVVGWRIGDVDLRRIDILARGGGRRRRTGALAPSLEGRRITGLGRHGKLLLCGLDDDAWLLIHLGMSGQILVADAERALPRHDHVHLLLRLDRERCVKSSDIHAKLLAGDDPATNGTQTIVVAFRDPRRFGGVLHCHGRDGLPAPWSSYGPDAVTGAPPGLHLLDERGQPGPPHPANRVSPQLWAARFGGTRTGVKPAMLDQRRLAGIGNIYADEILHRAGVHPGTPCDRVSRPRWRRIADAAAEILAGAIEAGGSTIRDYADPENRPGEFTRRHAVYGRSGLPCIQCGRTLQLNRLAGRATVHCSRCQRLR